jgi:hypothetical protein
VSAEGHRRYDKAGGWRSQSYCLLKKKVCSCRCHRRPTPSSASATSFGVWMVRPQRFVTTDLDEKFIVHWEKSVFCGQKEKKKINFIIFTQLIPTSFDRQPKSGELLHHACIK